KAATTAVESGADVGDGAVAVVSNGFDEHGGAAGAVAFVQHFFQLRGVLGADGFVDGAVDDVHRHVAVAGLEDGEPQARVAVRVTATGPSRDGNLASELGKGGAALGVNDGLLALDLLPF